MKINYREQLKDYRPYWKVIVSLAFSLLGTFLFVFLGAKLLIYLMPFVIGWFLSYLVSPIVNWLEKRLKIVKKLGSALIIVLVLAAVIGVFYCAGNKLSSEITDLIQNLPGLYNSVESGLTNVGSEMAGILRVFPEGIREAFSVMADNLDTAIGNIISQISEPTVSAAGRIAKKIPSIFVSIIVTLISAYFFIAERERLIVLAKKITPDPIVKRMSIVMYDLKYAVGGYFFAQLKIMGVVFAILIVGFAIIGIQFNFLLALLIAFLDFLPFFGTAISFVPWAIYKFMVGDYRMAIALLILYAVTQIVRQSIQPKLVGDSVGLH
ncbi:MAG: sporulation integral membrane protein YtvI, partial [Dorea sp.]